MASRAIEYRPPIVPEAAHRARLAMDAGRAAKMKFDTSSAADTSLTIDLGLRSGISVRYTPAGRFELPEALVTIAGALRRIEKLEQNWDSYGGFALSDAAVLPAMELALESVRRCGKPDLVPLPTGGIGLRWFSPLAELEIDVRPDGRAIAVYEDLETGEIEEVDEPKEAGELFPLVHRFCSKI